MSVSPQLSNRTAWVDEDEAAREGEGDAEEHAPDGHESVAWKAEGESEGVGERFSRGVERERMRGDWV